jgi:acyl carrier protein
LSPDHFDREVTEIVRRLSRSPVELTPESELLADLGFDSLRVLELVGELEDHFNIAVPLNALTHIRTVGQIADEVRRLAAPPAPDGRAARGATEGHPA